MQNSILPNFTIFNFLKPVSNNDGHTATTKKKSIPIRSKNHQNPQNWHQNIRICQKKRILNTAKILDAPNVPDGHVGHFIRPEIIVHGAEILKKFRHGRHLQTQLKIDNKNLFGRFWFFWRRFLDVFQWILDLWKILVFWFLTKFWFLEILKTV